MDCTVCDLCLEGFERNMNLLLDWSVLGKELVRSGEQHLIFVPFVLQCSNLVQALLILVILGDLNVPDSAT